MRAVRFAWSNPSAGLNHTSINQLAWMIVKFRVAIACSTAALASPSGEGRAGDLRNETKRNLSTLQLFAAFTRFNCPAASTDSIESPGWRESVEDAVEITESTPRQAVASESGFFRSPTHNSTP